MLTKSSIENELNSIFSIMRTRQWPLNHAPMNDSNIVEYVKKCSGLYKHLLDIGASDELLSLTVRSFTGRNILAKDENKSEEEEDEEEEEVAESDFEDGEENESGEGGEDEDEDESDPEKQEKELEEAQEVLELSGQLISKNEEDIEKKVQNTERAHNSGERIFHKMFIETLEKRYGKFNKEKNTFFLEGKAIITLGDLKNVENYLWGIVWRKQKFLVPLGSSPRDFAQNVIFRLMLPEAVNSKAKSMFHYIEEEFKKTPKNKLPLDIGPLVMGICSKGISNFLRVLSNKTAITQSRIDAAISHLEEQRRNLELSIRKKDTKKIESLSKSIESLVVKIENMQIIFNGIASDMMSSDDPEVIQKMKFEEKSEGPDGDYLFSEHDVGMIADVQDIVKELIYKQHIEEIDAWMKKNAKEKAYKLFELITKKNLNIKSDAKEIQDILKVRGLEGIINSLISSFVRYAIDNENEDMINALYNQGLLPEKFEDKVTVKKYRGMTPEEIANAEKENKKIIRIRENEKNKPGPVKMIYDDDRMNSNPVKNKKNDKSASLSLKVAEAEELVFNILGSNESSTLKQNLLSSLKQMSEVISHKESKIANIVSYLEQLTLILE